MQSQDQAPHRRKAHAKRDRTGLGSPAQAQGRYLPREEAVPLREAQELQDRVLHTGYLRDGLPYVRLGECKGRELRREVLLCQLSEDATDACR